MSWLNLQGNEQASILQQPQPALGQPGMPLYVYPVLPESRPFLLLQPLVLAFTGCRQEHTYMTSTNRQTGPVP